MSLADPTEDWARAQDRVAASAGQAALRPLSAQFPADGLPDPVGHQGAGRGLTRHEQDVLLHEQRFGGAAYNNVLLYRLRAGVDTDRLLDAIVAALGEQDSPRGRVATAQDGTLLLRTVAGPQVETSWISVPDADDVPSGSGFADVLTRPFDLSKGPLFRVRFVVQASTTWLALVGHQLAWDGASMVLAREAIERLYRHGISARQAPQGPRGRSREPDRAELGEAQGHWSGLVEQAGGVSRIRDATPSRSIPGSPGWVNADNRLLSPDLAAGIFRLSQSAQVTRFVVLLLAFGRAVARWTRRDQALVAFAVDARTDEEEDGLWGSYVNTQLASVRLGTPSTDMLKDLSAQLMESLPWRDLPVVLDGRSGAEALPDFYLVYNRGQFEPLDLDGNRCLREPVGLVRALHPVSIDVFEDVDGFRITCSYDPNGLTPERGRAFADLFVAELRSLAGLAQDPDPALPAPSPTLMEGAHESFPAIFRRCVEAEPDKVAVIEPAARDDAAGCSHREWTLAQLDLRARRVAAWLHRHGASRGDVIALICQRGGEHIAAMIGVMQAGCAFVSLDPHQDATDLAAQIESLDVGIVVARRAVTDILRSAWEPKADPGPQVLDLDALAGTEPGAVMAEPPLGPGDRAYVVLSSGTTGRPKACVNHHGGLVNHILSEVGLLHGFGRDSRVLQLAPVSFDIHVWQCLGPLITGGQVVVADDPADLDRVARTIRQHGVTLVESIPAYLNALAPLMQDNGGAATVKTVMLTGEATRVDQLEELALAYPGVQLVNAWGPAEAADDVLQWERPPAFLGSTASHAWLHGAPIGYALPGLGVRVVDEGGRALPDGCVGELAVAGPAVGEGYLGQPRLTAAKFRPDPGSATPGSRLYWTGDSGYRSSQGCFHFLGRLDNRVKVSGGWVDLDVISSTLASLDGVLEVSVSDVAGPQGTRLVACVVLSGEPAGPGGRTAADLRHAAAAVLPSRSVPDLFLVRDSIPRTVNGKVCQRSVRQIAQEAYEASPVGSPGAGHEQAGGNLTGPQQTVLAVVTEVLGVAPPSLWISLPEAGARSIDMMRLSAALKRELDGACSVAELYRCPRLLDVVDLAVARSCDRQGRSEAEGPLRFPVPASPLQTGLWATCELLGSEAFLLPVAIRVSGTVNIPRLKTAAQRLHEQFWVLRARVTEDFGGLWFSPVPPTSDWVEEIIWDGPLTPETVAALTVRPFDLRAGRSATAVLVCALDHQCAVLTVNVHHIVFDGRSADLLVAAFHREYANAGQ